MAYAIEARGLTKVFGKFKAVDSIDLLIKEGEIFGLLGPNGAGKTTTLRMILGLIKPTSGWVKVFGLDVEKYRKEVLKLTGYMPQHFSLYEDLTVEENLRLYGRLYGLKGRELDERIKELLREFQLLEYRRRLAGKLSGGTKQRLALAVALVHSPRLLVVDEPTAGVDPPLRRYFWEYFRRLRSEGVTILITTHYMDEAEHCQRLAFIQRGRLVAQGSPQEIKETHMSGEVLEIDCATPDKAIHILRDMDLFAEVALYGAQIHVVTTPDADARAQSALIAQALADEQIPVQSIERIVPSLEDVFIASVS